jgi:hypothetical protein
MENNIMENKKIILSTGDIKRNYQIKGIANIETRVKEENLNGGWANFKISEAYAKMNAHLAETAKKSGNDAILFIKYSHITLPNFDFVVTGSGTMVKFID